MSELSIQAASAPASLHAEPSPPDYPAPTVAAAQSLVATALLQVEAELRRLLNSEVEFMSEVAGHLIFAGGKRLRPMLSLLVASAVDFPREHAVKIAAMGELLHSATLLHDDVIDRGDFRRGRPSARYRFGNGPSVLSGDFCLARALQSAAEIGEIKTFQSIAKVVSRMTEGELEQLQHAGRGSLSRAQYYSICEGKTAQLIAWCSSLSGLLPAELDAAMHGFGLEVGYAFQIADDMIDYRFDVRASGKARAQDLREGKITLPLLLACEDSARLQSQVQRLLTLGAPVDTAEVEDIANKVVNSNAMRQAQAIADQHVQNALGHLKALPPTPARQALVELSQTIVRRSL